MKWNNPIEWEKLGSWNQVSLYLLLTLSPENDSAFILTCHIVYIYIYIMPSRFLIVNFTKYNRYTTCLNSTFNLVVVIVLNTNGRFLIVLFSFLVFHFYSIIYLTPYYFLFIHNAKRPYFHYNLHLYLFYITFWEVICMGKCKLIFLISYFNFQLQLSSLPLNSSSGNSSLYWI